MELEELKQAQREELTGEAEMLSEHEAIMDSQNVNLAQLRALFILSTVCCGVRLFNSSNSTLAYHKLRVDEACLVSKSLLVSDDLNCNWLQHRELSESYTFRVQQSKHLFTIAKLPLPNLDMHLYLFIFNSITACTCRVCGLHC